MAYFPPVSAEESGTSLMKQESHYLILYYGNNSRKFDGRVGAIGRECLERFYEPSELKAGKTVRFEYKAKAKP